MTAPQETDASWRPAPGHDLGALGPVVGGRWALIQQHGDRAAYRVDTDRGPLFVKHYRPGSVSGCLRDFVLRRKPQRAAALAGRLLDAGVSTPRCLGLYTGWRDHLRQALLVTEWVHQADNWAQYLVRTHGGTQCQAEIRAVLKPLAGELGLLHRMGYYHGDLSGNLLLAGEPGSCKPYLIDLEELRRPLTWKRRVKNLEEVSRGGVGLDLVPLSVRWRFLLHYGEVAGLAPARCRKLWRDGRTAQMGRIRRARSVDSDTARAGGGHR